MGRYCVVLGCNSNTDRARRNGEPRKSLFRFPLDRPELLEKWKNCIPRDFKSYTVHRNSMICESHFEEKFLVTTGEIRGQVSRKLLRSTAVPTIFKEAEINRREPVRQPAVARLLELSGRPDDYIVEEHETAYVDDEMGGETEYEIVVKEEPNCRFCQKKFTGHKLEITQEIEQQFKDLTQMELLDDPNLSRYICDICNNSLSYCNFWRDLFIDCQMNLLKTAQEQDVNDNDEVIEVTDNEEIFESIDETTEDYTATQDPMFTVVETTTDDVLHEKEISCPECNSVMTEIFLGSHMEGNSTNKTSLSCDLCGYNTEAIEPVPSNVTKHSQISILKCKKCPKLFTDEKSLDTHDKITHGEKDLTFICEVCEEVFNTKRMLLIHTKKFHANNKLYLYKTANQKAARESHVFFFCSHCGEKFSTKLELQNHIFIQHEPENATMIGCKVFGCQALFNQKELYRNHILIDHSKLSQANRHKLLVQLQKLG